MSFNALAIDLKSSYRYFSMGSDKKGYMNPMFVVLIGNHTGYPSYVRISSKGERAFFSRNELAYPSLLPMYQIPCTCFIPHIHSLDNSIVVYFAIWIGFQQPWVMLWSCICIVPIFRATFSSSAIESHRREYRQCAAALCVKILPL